MSKTVRARLKKNSYSICNLCGRLLDDWDLQERLQIKTILGYGSKYDGHKVNLRLCCSCFDNLVDRCSNDPVGETVAMFGA